ncbi:MAG: LL-diaminopimelate aminotransferase, partial [Thermodesulfobacteriota bacterium]
GKDIEFANAEEVSEFFIRKAHISTVPWDDAGAFLRFSATFAAGGEADERRVTEELSSRLKSLELVF